MNSFYKNNKALFVLLLGILWNISLCAITYDNEPLCNTIQPGEVLVATFPENSYVILEMKKDNLNIKDICLTYEQSVINILREYFARVRFLSTRYSMSSNFSNGKRYKNIHLKEKDVDLKATILLELIDCLLEIPYISITGNQINFKDCFLINPQVLDFHIDSLVSDYRSIQVIFHNQSQNPTLIDGSVDFLGSKIKKTLCLTNVKQIIIDFNPQVWDNSSSFENSKSSLELTVSNSFRGRLKNAFKRLLHLN